MRRRSKGVNVAAGFAGVARRVRRERGAKIMVTQSGMTPVQEAAEQAGSGGLVVRRWIGCWVDMLVVLAIVVGIGFGAQSAGATDEVFAVYLGGALLLGLLYFPVCEGLWGRTLGKVLTGLKVVDANGRTPNIGRVLLRTLFRLIEVNPFLLGGIPAGICVLCTKRKQRLGDLAAGTYVLPVSAITLASDVDSVVATFN